MNGSRQAFTVLLSRCRNVFHPSLSCTPNYLLNRCTSVTTQRWTFFSGPKANTNSTDDFPKLPVEKPMAFATDLLGRALKQVEWCTTEQKLDMDQIIHTNESAEKILLFTTECLAEENFEILEEKFSPEALNEARSIVAGLPRGKKRDIIFQSTSGLSIFSGKVCVFTPWAHNVDGNCLNLTYIGFYASTPQQTAWLMSLAIPKDGTTLSEDFKITRFCFRNYSSSEDSEDQT